MCPCVQAFVKGALISHQSNVAPNVCLFVLCVHRARVGPEDNESFFPGAEYWLAGNGLCHWLRSCGVGLSVAVWCVLLLLLR